MYVMLITPENRSRYTSEMDEVYRLRHKTFNEWLGWNLPHENGREIDEYDDKSLHLTALDPAGDVLATWRMMPTTRRYMTAEVFPDLMEDLGVVSDPAIWDLSRFAVNRPKIGDNKALRDRLLAAMASALFEFGIMNGITEYLSVQNTFITPFANRMLGDPVWQSEKLDAGATDAALYTYQPSFMRLTALRSQFGLSTPVLSQFQITALQAAA